MFKRICFSVLQITSLVVLFAVGGCALQVKPNPNSYTFLNQNQDDLNRVPKKTFLILTDAFTKSNYSYWRGFDPYCWHVGPSLKVYSIHMVERHFKDVVVVRTLDATGANEGDLILKPTVTNLELTSFLWGGEKQNLTIDVEWTLKAKGNPSPLWIETSSGNSEGTQGTPFSQFKGGREMIQALILDLWNNTDQDFKVLHRLLK